MKAFMAPFTAILVWAVPVLAQRPADFVGTWELDSIEMRNEAGEWVPAAMPIAGEPVGILMYDDAGNMAVQITWDPRSDEAPAEVPEIVHGYVAYYGRYEVDAEAGTITHHRRHHVNPAFGDMSVVRHFQLEGDVLTLTVAPELQRRLHWVRVR